MPAPPAERRLGELAQLFGRELAEAAEMRDPDVLADLAQHDVPALQPREDLGDLELVVEIGLEPQHEVARVGVERAVARLELTHVHADELGAPPHPVRSFDDRTFVQRIPPGQDRLGDPALLEQPHGAVPVGDVQRAARQQLRAGGRVGLPRAFHPLAHAALEVGVGWSSSSSGPSALPSGRRGPAVVRRCLPLERSGPPFASGGRRGWGSPVGGSARAAAVAAESTPPRCPRRRPRR